MGWLDGYIAFVKKFLPTPFTIAVLLSALTYLLVLLFTGPGETGTYPYALEVLKYWEGGVWDPSLLVFAVQMMLILVLGHALALAPVFDRIISRLLVFCNTTSKAAAIVAFFTMLVGLFNWGLGLIFGAVFARKVGDYTSEKGIKINYPLIGAAGYSAMVIWHGGLSGSSLVKVAEAGHLKELMGSSLEPAVVETLPETIPLSSTIFSTLNGFTALAMLGLLPALFYFIGKKLKAENAILPVETKQAPIPIKLIGAEKLDHSTLAARLTGGAILLYIVLKIFVIEQISVLEYFTPNNINLLLLALCLFMHSSFAGFLTAVDEAIVGAAGILIQFPLYFGIMGMISGSGLINLVSEGFIQFSNEKTFPLFAFLSAGLVNIFVPSGGGQWIIQGPVLIKAAIELGVPLEKCILALAYGDELTNMLQPFWALPLLGITKLSARQVLPYTLFVFLLAFVVYGLAIFVF